MGTEVKRAVMSQDAITTPGSSFAFVCAEQNVVCF